MSLTQAQQDFITYIVPKAQQGYTTYGIFASVTIAQAINESGWGGSYLARTDNNLFGIKYPGNHDPSISVTQGTWATDDGGYYAHYNSWGDSCLDHGYFLKNNSRYTQAGVFSATTASEQVQAIANAGYATESDYYQVTMNIINSYNLTQYDSGSPPDPDPDPDPQPDVYGDDYFTVYESYFTKYDDLSQVYKQILTTPYIMQQLSAEQVLFLRTLNFNDNVHMKFSFNHGKKEIGKNYLGNKLTFDNKEYKIISVRSNGFLVLSTSGSICYNYLNPIYIYQTSDEKSSTKDVNVEKIKKHRADEKKEEEANDQGGTQ